ncbi:TetR/AcrR family transcriptional regulator [Bacteroidota bacterium]
MELYDRIVSEAFELFMKYGIRNVTMDQISGQMGISKRTLYETFKDKNELLREVLEYFSNIKRTEAGEMIEKSDNVIKTIYMLARKGEEMKQKINPLFFEDIWKYYPDIHTMLTKDGSYRDSSFTHKLVKKGIDDGLFKKDLDIELVNLYFHQVMHIVMNEEIFPRDRYTHGEIFKNIIMPYLIGISTDKGQVQIDKYFEKEIK